MAGRKHPFFDLGTAGEGFSGRSAQAFKAKLDLTERELDLAVQWALRCDPEWMPAQSLSVISASASAFAPSQWEKRVFRELAGTGENSPPPWVGRSWLLSSNERRFQPRREVPTPRADTSPLFEDNVGRVHRRS